MMLRKFMALAVTLGVLSLGFFWPVRVRVDVAFWGHVFDVAHVPLLGWLAAVLFYALPERVQPAVRRHGLALLLALGFALAVEWLQPHFGRSKSWRDVGNGGLGAALMLTGIAAWRRTGNWWWRGSHALALVLVMGVALWPAYREWQGLRWRQSHFPSLGNFESAEELKLWRPQGGAKGHPTQIGFTRAHASEGEQSLRIVSGRGDWAGVSYSGGDRDWSGFRALSLRVFNPRDPFTVYVRVDDDGDCRRLADRFERGFEVVQGWNRIRLPTSVIAAGPRERQLNLLAVRRVAVFTGADQPQRHWFLDDVHLEARDE